MKCPKCTGKIRIKRKGGRMEYKCCSCHRKFVVDVVKGGLRQVAV